MYSVFACNKECAEQILVDDFSTKAEAFDFIYKHKRCFYNKGQWVLQVKNASGDTVYDDRFLA